MHFFRYYQTPSLMAIVLVKVFYSYNYYWINKKHLIYQFDCTEFFSIITLWMILNVFLQYFEDKINYSFYIRLFAQFAFMLHGIFQF